MELKKLGVYAFIASIAIAVIAGLVSVDPVLVTQALIVLGIIVGILNVTEKETSQFMMATVVLVIVSYCTGDSISAIPMIGAQLQSILLNIMTFVTPAVILVALKQIYNIAKD
ncbi:MAG: hypothetical protein U9P44_01345 [archaeon]|nr:hypothetical protein [archaeon]